MSYETGSLYRAAFSVTDLTGAPVDPASEVLTVTLPDQTTATPAVTHDGVGAFHADYLLSQDGLYRFALTTVSPARVYTEYVSAAAWRSIVATADVKAFINDIDPDDDSQDPILRKVMAAATESVENLVGTCVPRLFTNERVAGFQKQVIRLPHAPLLTDTSIASITSVFPGGPAWVTADLIAYPDSATCETVSRMPFWWGPWKATYTSGRTVIPESIQLAVQEIIFDLWSIHRLDGSGELEPGPEDTARFEQMLTTYQVPQHARMLLAPYEMPGFA
jgi:hypothetical protein